jgi:hypothetical protein
MVLLVMSCVHVFTGNELFMVLLVMIFFYFVSGIELCLCCYW